jgi:hypothetical protein
MSASEGMILDRSVVSHQIRKATLLLFLWNLGLHLLASAWLTVSMVDRHPLSSITGDGASSPMSARIGIVRPFTPLEFTVHPGMYDKVCLRPRFRYRQQPIHVS